MVVCHCKAEEPGYLDREVMIYTVLMDLLLCNPVLGQTPFFESWVLLVVLVLNGSLHWLYDILVLVPKILEEVAGLLRESELLIELFLFERTTDKSRTNEAFWEKHLLVELREEAYLLNSLNETQQGLIPLGNIGDDIFKQEKDFGLLTDGRRLLQFLL